MQETKLELPHRPATTITYEDDWVYIQQTGASGDVDRVALHSDDLQTIIDFLCDIAGIGDSRP